MEPRRKKRLRIACLQVNAGEDTQKNLCGIRRQISAALDRGADFIALPEMFYARTGAQALAELAREVTPQVLDEFRLMAFKRRVVILLGSVVEKSPHPKRFYNTSILISEKGEIAARYRKIHLFDVNLKNIQVQESRHVMPGRKVVTGRVFGITAGLAVCYDLRFPELFRLLTERGSRILCVPANFTYVTGKAHWEVLLKARAIENQAFVIAPAQVGTHPVTGIRSFGNSLVLDPWGRVLARGGANRPEVILADLDLGMQRELRMRFPVLTHRWLKG